MKAKQLKEKLQSCICDICFDYNGKSACINPWTQNKFEVEYGNQLKTFTNIDELMSAKLFNSKSLNEICETLNIEFV